MSDDAVTAPGVQAVPAASAQRVFWATWLGWMLDGFDSAIYQMVLVPAMLDLLPASGLAPARGTVAAMGGLLFSVFMLGWACSMVWGWIADRIGRVPAMCLTILLYSVATALCGLAPGLLLFGLFRFLAGFGIGGEWAAGTPLLQESVPERLRVRLAGWLHTATPTGILLAALATLLFYGALGWRGMFLLGILPALLVAWLRMSVPESPKWQAAKARQVAPPSLRTLFLGPLARRTWAAGLMMACIIFGLWSSTFWIPTFIVTRMTTSGATLTAAQRLASGSSILVNLGTLAGCLLMPWIAARFGRRRPAAVFFFAGALIANGIAWLGFASLPGGLLPFVLMLPLLGFFTNSVFALYTIWLPEIFPTAQRALGSGFAFSFGRLFGALGPGIVGTGAALTGSYPVAIAGISLIYAIGLPFIGMAPETAGEALPE